MKNIIVILLFICTSIMTHAQVNKKDADKYAVDTTAKFRNELFSTGRVSFGLKAGFTLANIGGSDVGNTFADSKTDYLPSFHAGIMVNSMMGKYFWLKHELLIIQKGAGVTLQDSTNGKYSSTLKMLSLDLFPFSPTFHVKGFQLYAGPYASVLIDAQIKRKDNNGQYYEDHSIFGDGSQFENKSKYLQKFDFGINAGIEYQFPFGVALGIKYTHGFVDIFQYANSYTLNDGDKRIKIYNRSLLFSIAYSFGQKKQR
ncbi:MAG TPA: porin family protein [Cytophagaceae bacterium]|jgi:hypothetical protein|nr:porin family protein [Cytophagaceae bacterium]